MWHKADDGVGTAGAKSVWLDASGNGRDVIQTNNAAYQPTLVTNASYTANAKNYTFNFNPFYYFDGVNDFFYRLNDSYFPTTTSPGSTYGVLYNSTAGGYNTAYGWGDDDPNLARVGDTYQFWRDNGLPLTTPANASTRPAHIAGMAWRGSTNGLYLNVDGQIASTTSYNIGNINSATPPNFAIGSEGFNLTGTGNEKFQGSMSEVFAYSQDHQNSTGDEKQRINSYLAIKYGITLKNDAGTAVPNYLSSASTVVWNATTNTGYSSNIAGLARDESSALNQKQSRSNTTGQQVVIGTTGLANTNALNTTGLAADGQYLVWGDNGLAKALSTPITGFPAVNLRFAAIWKVQNTGAVGTVRVAWPSGTPALSLIQSTDAVFDASDTRTDMTANTQVINGLAYNYADVTLADGQFFTFAGYVAGPGGVGQDLSLWYRADNGVETDASSKVTAWSNSTVNDVKLTMSGSSAYIPYNDQTTYTKTWNFNPTLSFDGTNNYLRNTTTAYLNSAGSVHYITVARLNSSASGFNSVFAIAGNDDGFFLYPQGGLIYPMPAIGNGYNATAAGPGSANRYGIYSAILPKTGSPANQRGFYNGLQKIYTSPYPITGGSYSLPTTGAYIGADGTTGDNPDGDIAEVVVYHNPGGGDMLNADLARIHSYLALKYGITLDQTTPQNYVNSSSSIVWSATANTGYQYSIAGIARDDQGGLYQKQSKSVNPGRQVLISTTGLASTNGTNTATLTNGQFLIWGDNNLAKAPTVAISGVSGVNYRFASIWKVQNVGAVGTVRVAWPKGYANLKLIQSTDATIDASDNITDMTSVQTVNGIDYAYADVTLSDGQYFTFAAFIQAPGGVTNNLSYWYRADKFAVSEGDGTDVTAWTDFVSGTTSEQLNNAPLPKYKNGEATYFNFNPGVSFTAVQQMLGNIDVQTLTNTNYDIYSLTKEGMSGTRFFNVGMNNTTFNGTNWDQPGFYANGVIARRSSTGALNYSANPGSVAFSTTAPSIMYHTFTNTTLSKGLNGAANGTTDTHSAIGQVVGGHIFGANGGVNPPGGDDLGIVGNIGELVIYGNGNNTAAERNKVDSYLAIKYGVTLANNNNYTTSQNAVVWDATANAGYYNNVAGIGYDYVSALEQKQSRSQNANANNQVIIGLGGIAETNMANTSSLNDGQFLVWGDNGNTQAMTNTAGTYTAFTYAGTSVSRRMNRIWKVQNTNNVSGTVTIRFPQASVGTTTLSANDACANYVIIYADDAAFTTNVSVVPVTLNGTDYETTHVFPAGASFFTFGKATPISTGVVYLPSVTETTNQTSDNCGISSAWTYFRKSNDASLKLFATSGIATDQLTVTITPEGTTYDDGTRVTNLMPRIATVSASTSLSVTGKVRVYYSTSELNGTAVAGAQTNSWFKYNGGADDAKTDIYSDGTFDAGKAIQLTPAASGVEDGVNYVEFNNVDPLGSFIYVSSTESTVLATTDLTLVLYARPSTVNGTQPITVVGDVFELNSIATSGPVSVRISKDTQLTLSFDPAATSIGGRPVTNSGWNFSGPSGGYYTLTSKAAIGAGATLSFGLSGTVTPGATTGSLTISGLVQGTGFAEANMSNNSDAEKIEYFQQ